MTSIPPISNGQSHQLGNGPNPLYLADMLTKTFHTDQPLTKAGWQTGLKYLQDFKDVQMPNVPSFYKPIAKFVENIVDNFSDASPQTLCWTQHALGDLFNFQSNWFTGGGLPSPFPSSPTAGLLNDTSTFIETLPGDLSPEDFFTNDSTLNHEPNLPKPPGLTPSQIGTYPASRQNPTPLSALDLLLGKIMMNYGSSGDTGKTFIQDMNNAFDSFPSSPSEIPTTKAGLDQMIEGDSYLIPFLLDNT